MPGTYEQKFAGERIFYAWQMAHPGKKLTFMGSEIGQFREWDYQGEIEWFLLDYEAHEKMQRYFAALNHFYLSHPALWQRDDGWDGFSWIDPNDRDRSVLSFVRRGEREEDELLVLLNFTPVPRLAFGVNVPRDGSWREVFNSDESAFGGSGTTNPAPLVSLPAAKGSTQHYITPDLPPLGAIVLQRVPEKKTRAPRKKKSSPGAAAPRNK
jgi:1,4-alpha-glucan branching enzyme